MLDGWWLSPFYPLQPAQDWMKVFAKAGFASTAYSVGSSADLNTQQLLVGSNAVFGGSLTSLTVSGTGRPVRKETLVYKTVDDVDIEADVYLPEAPSSTLMPIAILIHGGGHMTLSRQAVRPQQIVHLLARGVLPVSIDYRLAPEINIIEGAFEDVRDAVTWARDKLPPLMKDKGIRLDPKRLAVVGWSSGGQLAMSTGWTLPRLGLPAPNVIVSFYAPVDFLSDDLFPRNQVGIKAKFSPERLAQIQLRPKPLTNYTVGGDENPELGWVKSGDPRSECLAALFSGGAEVHRFGLSLMLSGQAHHRTVGEVVASEVIPERCAEACPTAHVKAGDYRAPTYIVHGEADQIAPFSSAVRLHEELERQGVRSGFTIKEMGGHVLDVRLKPGDPDWSVHVAPAYAFMFELLSV